MPQPHRREPAGREILIALGSNATSHAGDARETVLAALQELQAVFGEELVCSRLFATPCFPAGAGPDYVNAACWAHQNAAPKDVLTTLHKIEMAFGREREQRWGQRTLDLDLIAVGDAILPDEASQTAWRNLPLDAQKTQAPDQLILPHPRLQDRSFVLVPLAEIAPGWAHPVLGLSIAEMLAARPKQERDEVKPL